MSLSSTNYSHFITLGKSRNGYLQPRDSDLRFFIGL